MVCRPAPLRLTPLALALLAPQLAPATAFAEETPTSIETPGKAKFQICRDWMMFVTCNDYSRVEVPPKISVGDRLFLAFGSNYKTMAFPVAAIRLSDGVCTLYTEPPTPGTNETAVDKLTIEACKAAP
jgi:hypothetical protein